MSRVKEMVVERFPSLENSLRKVESCEDYYNLPAEEKEALRAHCVEVYTTDTWIGFGDDAEYVNVDMLLFTFLDERGRDHTVSDILRINEEL